MKGKILIVGIIVLIIVLALGISGCRCQRNLMEGESNSIQTEKETPAETPKEIEMEELRKSHSLFISEVTQADSSVNGIVKEISGRNLTITEFIEKGEEKSSLVVPIAQGAEIISNYILYSFPRGTSNEEIDEYLRSQIPEKKEGEEITGMGSGPKGEICYFGEKEISFEKITIGDVVFIVLDSKSGSMEGTYVEVWPVDFYDQSKLVILQ